MYRLSKQFPKDERYGLTSQVRRAIASVPANIAESCGYKGGAASARFLYIALGSRAESLDHLIAALDLGYLAKSNFDPLEGDLDAIGKMLVSLIRRMTGAIRR